MIKFFFLLFLCGFSQDLFGQENAHLIYRLASVSKNKVEFIVIVDDGSFKRRSKFSGIKGTWKQTDDTLTLYLFPPYEENQKTREPIVECYLIGEKKLTELVNNKNKRYYTHKKVRRYKFFRHNQEINGEGKDFFEFFTRSSGRKWECPLNCVM